MSITTNDDTKSYFYTPTQIANKLKAEHPSMPVDFDWDLAEMNARNNAEDTDHEGCIRDGQASSRQESFLVTFKATLEMYIDQEVHSF
jgi:hypothetical protein|tara:strand:+ start:411 stop:674 length:264 start_codon:yes stop_codon:yes gene_type:complete